MPGHTSALTRDGLKGARIGVLRQATGFPAIQVPMGYTRDGTLPAAVTFFGRAWDEMTLIALAYSCEQHPKHRGAPASAPPLGATAK